MEGATLFDMACRGEGEAWSRRVLLALLVDGGLARLEEGAVSPYARCPWEAALHRGGPVPT